MYGRGYSDAPHTTYDVNLYTTQLALLLQYVGWSKADIVGVSMVRFPKYARPRLRSHDRLRRVAGLQPHSLRSFRILSLTR